MHPNPCPFCKTNFVHVEEIQSAALYTPRETVLSYQVMCRVCAAIGPRAPSMSEAVDLWDAAHVKA